MKVLIPVDGSTCSEATLAWATANLDQGRTQYFLLYVVQSVPGLPQEIYEIEDAHKLLQDARQKLESSGSRVIKATYISNSNPPKAICQYAEEIDAQQILIGTHGRTGLSGMLMGSVSRAVLEICERPVFIYRNIARNNRPGKGRRRIEVQQN